MPQDIVNAKPSVASVKEFWIKPTKPIYGSDKSINNHSKRRVSV